MANEERLRELEDKYEGYTVYDNRGSKIGKVDDLFVDETDHEEYIGVKMGFLGMKSTLIPTEVVRVNENDRTIEVSESKDHVKSAPSFDDDEDITPDYEERIRRHFGLESLEASTGRGSYSGSTASGTAGAGTEGRESSHSETTDRDREASDYETRGTGDRSEGSGVDTEHGERAGSSTGAADTGRDTGEYRSTEGSTDREEYRDTSGTTDRGGTFESEERRDTGTTGSSGEETSTQESPGTSRQTEETETFQEGGRTKIRRRIISEEVVDADDQGNRP